MLKFKWYFCVLGLTLCQVSLVLTSTQEVTISKQRTEAETILELLFNATVIKNGAFLSVRLCIVPSLQTAAAKLKYSNAIIPDLKNSHRPKNKRSLSKSQGKRRLNHATVLRNSISSRETTYSLLQNPCLHLFGCRIKKPLWDLNFSIFPSNTPTHTLHNFKIWT